MIKALLVFSENLLKNKVERENVDIEVIKGFIENPQEKNPLKNELIVVYEKDRRKVVIIADKSDDKNLLNQYAEKIATEKNENIQNCMESILSSGIHGVLSSFQKEGKRGIAINKLVGTAIFSSFPPERSTTLSMMGSALAMAADETSLAMHLGEILEVVVSGDDKQIIVKDIANGILFLIEHLPTELDTIKAKLSELNQVEVT